MKHKLKSILTLVLLILSFVGQAQTVDNFLRNDNKINAVIVIVVIILTGLFAFLFYIERKVKSLEDKED